MSQLDDIRARVVLTTAMFNGHSEFMPSYLKERAALLAALDAVLALHVPEPPVQLKNGFLDVEPNCAGCIADCHCCEGVHFYADCPVRKAITEALEAS